MEHLVLIVEVGFVVTEVVFVGVVVTVGVEVEVGVIVDVTVDVGVIVGFGVGEGIKGLPTLKIDSSILINKGSLIGVFKTPLSGIEI